MGPSLSVDASQYFPESFRIPSDWPMKQHAGSAGSAGNEQSPVYPSISSQAHSSCTPRRCLEFFFLRGTKAFSVLGNSRSRYC